MPRSTVNIAVVGCGGIGGLFVAKLLRAGYSVTPIVNRAALHETLRVRGLEVEDADASRFRVKLLPVDTSRLFDVVIMATQSTTLAEALRDVLPRLAKDGVVVTCQNGLPEAHARRVLENAGRSPECVVGCVVGFGASMVAPGEYHQTSSGGLQLGRSSVDSVDPLEVAQIFADVAPTTVVQNFVGVRWSKLAINCVTTTFGALSGLPLGKLLAYRSIRRLALEVFAEVAAVAKAAGVAVEPVGGTLAIDSIAINDDDRGALVSPALLYKHAVLLAVGFKYRKMRSSMLYALERGRPVEIDFLNGEVVTRGAALGVSTPVNAALVAQLKQLVTHKKHPQLSYLQLS
jgi:2-dehydropantoate 2-reductase